MSEKNKTITVYYYALLREQRGVSEETIKTHASTAKELYESLCAQYSFSLDCTLLKAAVNNRYTDWTTPIQDGDTIVFIPPVAGG